MQQCQVLVAVFPFSQYTFAIALPSQKTADFAPGIVRALAHFGGLPLGIVSDNLKAFVIEPHRYEPTFNQLIEQLGHHYEIDLLAALPMRPKDKAAVEGGVKTVYTRLYEPLRNRLFTSVKEINVALVEQLTEHNARPFQKRSGSRLSVFTEQELPLLKSLPTSPFSPKTTVTAKVSLSYHVYLSERGK
jgi:transposase